MKEEKKIPNKLILGAVAVVTTFLVNTFLSGKIINIPKGTYEGGLISAIGVGIIMLIAFLAIIIFLTILKNKNDTIGKHKN